MGFHGKLAERQSEACGALLAGGAGLDLSELLEDPGVVFRGDAGTRIPDRHAHGLRTGVDADGNDAVGGGELQRVSHEVLEHPANQVRVRGHRHQVWGRVQEQLTLSA